MGFCRPKRAKARLDAQVFDRVAALGNRFDLLGESFEAFFEQGVDQTLLVVEVVIDGGRAVAAAIHQLAHRKAFRPEFEQQGLGRIEDHPTGFRAALVAALPCGHGRAPGARGVGCGAGGVGVGGGHCVLEAERGLSTARGAPRVWARNRWVWLGITARRMANAVKARVV